MSKRIDVRGKTLDVRGKNPAEKNYAEENPTALVF